MLVLMCLCGIFVITLMISKNTDYNVHQNEKVNYEIVEYYKNNNLPLKNSNDIQMDLYYIIVGDDQMSTIHLIYNKSEKRLYYLEHIV